MFNVKMRQAKKQWFNKLLRLYISHCYQVAINNSNATHLLAFIHSSLFSKVKLRGFPPLQIERRGRKWTINTLFYNVYIPSSLSDLSTSFGAGPCVPWWLQELPFFSTISSLTRSTVFSMTFLTTWPHIFSVLLTSFYLFFWLCQDLVAACGI